MASLKERKPAPPVAVDEVFRDDRAAMLADLDKQNPDFVHSFQAGFVKPEDLSRKGFEVVKDDKGVELQHETDIVVRVPREKHERRRAIESARSFESAKKILDGKDAGRITQFRSPRKVKRNKEEEDV